MNKNQYFLNEKKIMEVEEYNHSEKFLVDKHGEGIPIPSNQIIIWEWYCAPAVLVMGKQRRVNRIVTHRKELTNAGGSNNYRAANTGNKRKLSSNAEALILLTLYTSEIKADITRKIIFDLDR